MLLRCLTASWVSSETTFNTLSSNIISMRGENLRIRSYKAWADALMSVISSCLVASLRLLCGAMATICGLAYPTWRLCHRSRDYSSPRRIFETHLRRDCESMWMYIDREQAEIPRCALSVPSPPRRPFWPKLNVSRLIMHDGANCIQVNLRMAKTKKTPNLQLFLCSPFCMPCSWIHSSR